MKSTILASLVTALAAVALAGAYRLGQGNAAPTQGAPFLGAPLLEAQGRGPVVPPKPRSEPPTKAPEPLVFGGDSGGVAATNNGFMAVTGSYGVGTSVLYLIDTESKQLLVYEARGGSQSMRRLVLVGARRIDLDLQLIDYNDESEYTRSDLERLFRGGAKRTTGPDVTVPARPRTEGALGTGEYETRKRDATSGRRRDGR